MATRAVAPRRHFHHKHAMRLLGSGSTKTPRCFGVGQTAYDEGAREDLVVWWGASDRTYDKRLKPLLPTFVEAMERHGYLELADEVRCGLVNMSAATIDRALRSVREQGGCL